jgi:hypothetical protein
MAFDMNALKAAKNYNKGFADGYIDLDKEIKKYLGKDTFEDSLQNALEQLIKQGVSKHIIKLKVYCTSIKTLNISLSIREDNESYVVHEFCEEVPAINVTNFEYGCLDIKDKLEDLGLQIDYRPDDFGYNVSNMNPATDYEYLYIVYLGSI